MQRFLALYLDRDDNRQYYAEGLVHFDGAVYVRGFYPEVGKLFADMNALKNYLRDNDDIWHTHIQMIDEK